MTPLRTFFAVYQSGGPIYGVGTTRQDALDDAKPWLDTPETLDTVQEPHDAGEVSGQLYIRPCTRALYLRVIDQGGDLLYHLSDQHRLCGIEER